MRALLLLLALVLTACGGQDGSAENGADGPSIGGAPSLIGEATIGHHILVDEGTYVLDVGALVGRDQRDRIDAILERLATSAHARL